MNLDEIQYILNKQLLNLDNSCVNVGEIIVVRGILQNQTYKKLPKKKATVLVILAM